MEQRKGIKIEKVYGTNTGSLTSANKIVKFPSSLNKRKEKTHYHDVCEKGTLMILYTGTLKD